MTGTHHLELKSSMLHFQGFKNQNKKSNGFVRGWICVSFPGIAALLLSGLCSLSLISSAGSNTLLFVIGLHKWSLIILFCNSEFEQVKLIVTTILEFLKCCSESLRLETPLLACVLSVVWNWFPQNAPPVAKTIWQQQNSGTFLGR